MVKERVCCIDPDAVKQTDLQPFYKKYRTDGVLQSTVESAASARIGACRPAATEMERRLLIGRGRKLYKLQSLTVEPAFGQVEV